ncbi:hypothetical protein D3C80_1233310 [compost metagenome]
MPDTPQQPWQAFYRQLLHLRHQHIVPHLSGCHAEGAEVIGDKALSARWRLADGRTLRIDLNLSAAPVPCMLPQVSTHVYACTSEPLPSDQLPPFATLVSLLPSPSPEPVHD